MKDKNAIQNMSTKALLDELETRGIKFRTVPVQPNDTPEFIGQMVDIVEDFLEEKGVIILKRKMNLMKQQPLFTAVIMIIWQSNSKA